MIFDDKEDGMIFLLSQRQQKGKVLNTCYWRIYNNYDDDDNAGFYIVMRIWLVTLHWSWSGTSKEIIFMLTHTQSTNLFCKDFNLYRMCTIAIVVQKNLPLLIHHHFVQFSHSQHNKYMKAVIILENVWRMFLEQNVQQLMTERNHVPGRPH